MGPLFYGSSTSGVVCPQMWTNYPRGRERPSGHFLSDYDSLEVVHLMLDDLRSPAAVLLLLLFPPRVKIYNFYVLISGCLTDSFQRQASFFRLIGCVLVNDYRVVHHNIHKSHIHNNDLLPWMICADVVLTVPQGQWSIPTNLGFAILAGGLALAAVKTSRFTKR